MADRNGYVSTGIRFDPGLDQPPAEALREEREVSVELDDGNRVRLDPGDERAVGFAEILEELSRQGRPVYVEADASGAIERLLIPNVTRVIGLTPRDGGGFEVELEHSHARHLVPPDREDLASYLLDAFETKMPLVFVVDDAHEIIDIRAFKPNPEGPYPPLPEWPPLRRLWWPLWRRILWRIWLWHWWPWRWFRCVPASRAQAAFDAMAARTCDPLSVPPPCIPFMYPDDGCWARAHEMCRLMIEMGLRPSKVWIRGSLVAPTRNHPNCQVLWGWHVAPTLCVRGRYPFLTQTRVIDPSLFTGPVSKATWKGAQGDPAATLTDTSHTQYWPSGGTDPDYSQTAGHLADYRLHLKTRSLNVGPPPYANCP